MLLDFRCLWCEFHRWPATVYTPPFSLSPIPQFAVTRVAATEALDMYERFLISPRAAGTKGGLSALESRRARGVNSEKRLCHCLWYICVRAHSRAHRVWWEILRKGGRERGRGAISPSWDLLPHARVRLYKKHSRKLTARTRTSVFIFFFIKFKDFTTLVFSADVRSWERSAWN